MEWTRASHNLNLLQVYFGCMGEANCMSLNPGVLTRGVRVYFNYDGFDQFAIHFAVSGQSSSRCKLIKGECITHTIVGLNHILHTVYKYNYTAFTVTQYGL